MNDVRIKISVDEKEAVSDINKVGSAFGRLSTDAKNAAKGTEKLKTESNGAMQALKGFVTFEMGKKIFAFADAAIRASNGMKGLSSETREATKSYIDATASLKDLGNTFVLGITTAVGPAIALLASAAKEASEYWKIFFGVDEGAVSRRVQEAQAREAQTRIDVINLKKIIAGSQTAGGYSFSSLSESNQDRIRSNLSKQEALLITRKAELERARQDLIESQKVIKEPSKSTVKVGTISIKPKVEIEKKDDSDFWAMIDDQQKMREEIRTQKEDDAQAEKDMDRDILLFKIRKNKEEVANKKAMYKQLAEERETTKQAELDATAAGFGAAAQLAGSLAELQRVNAGKNKEQVKMALTLSQISATANTAEGITKAYAQGGVLGFVTGAAVGIAGLAQVSAIEQQKQKLADGGIIRGPSFGDTVQVQANGGEMMLTKSQQAQLFNMASNGGGGGGGGGNTINFMPTYSNGVTSIQKKKDYLEFAKVVKSVQSNRNYSRLNGAMV